MKQSFQNIYLPLLLFIIAFCSKLFFITSRDICLDEPFTIFHAQFPIIDIISLPTQNEPNPPLFMLLLHCWIKLFDISPFSVRLLPLLFNAFTVVFIYLIGKKHFNLWTGLLTASMFILSTYHFYFGLETRTYSLLSLGTAVSLYYFLSLITTPQRKYIIALIISNLLLIYSHYFGWFLVFVQFISCILYFKDKKAIKSMLLVLLLTGVLFLPMLPILIKQFLHSSQGTWVQVPSNSEYYNQLCYFFNSKQVLIFCALSILFTISHLVYSKKLNLIEKKLFVILFWWFIPYTIMFAISFKIPMFLNRYILFNTIGLYLFVAIIVNLLPLKKISYIIGITIITLFYSELQINSKDFYYREVKNLAENAKRKSNTNSVVLIYPHWADLGFMYYYDRNVFKNYEKYDSLLALKNVHHVWNSYEATDKLKTFNNKRILYVQDGQLDDLSIFNLLDSTNKLKDSVFYPQCFQLSVFNPR